MITGVQYQKKLQLDAVKRTGFSQLEIIWQQWQEFKKKECDIPVSGIVIRASEFINEGVQTVFMAAEELHVAYLVLDTREFDETDRLDEIVEEAAPLLQQNALMIYLENGYRRTVEGGYQCCQYSEFSYLKKKVEEYNQLCGRSCFGLCLNVGYANLLGKNLRYIVEEAADLLKLIHMNDNDGFHDDKQMPFTFTQGRGARTTDIFRLIGALNRAGYQGRFVFDTEGLFEKAPAAIQEKFLTLLYALTKEWEDALLLEQKLNQPEKQLILFGTGKMAYNFMCEWGYKYPPAFLVDNNSALWGQERYGIEIKSPETLTEIPAEERNVFICNQFYEQVGAQLEKMGVAYQCYNDNYYM